MKSISSKLFNLSISIVFHFLQVIIVTKTSAAKMDGREADRAMHDYPDSFRGKVVTFPRPMDQATDLAQPGNPDL